MPENEKGTLELLAIELANAFYPLQEKLTDEHVLDFLAELGVQFPEELKSRPDVTNALNNLIGLVGDIPALIQELVDAISDEDYSAIIGKVSSLISKTTDVIAAFDTFKTAVDNAAGALSGIDAGVITDFASNLSEKLVSYLVIKYLEGYYPIFNKVLSYLGIVVYTKVSEVTGDPSKVPFTRRELNMEAFKDLFDKPAEHFEDLYDWGKSSFDGEKLIDALFEILHALAIPVVYNRPEPGKIPSLELLFFKLQPKTDVSPGGLELLVNVDIPAGASITFPFIFDNWEIKLNVNLALSAGTSLTIYPGSKIEVVPPSGEVSGDAGLFLVGSPPEGASDFVIFGQSAGSRLTASKIRVGFTAGGAWDASSGNPNSEFGLEAAIENGQIVINLSDGDSFISNIFPEDGFTFDFDILAGWSSESGLYFRGSAALEVAIPVHKGIFGIELETLFLVFKISDGKLKPELSIAAKGELGPLNAVITRIGLEADLAFEDGNLGPLDFSLGFKPPNGVGLSIDAQGIKGGGFLAIFPDEGRYEGVMELDFNNMFALTAIGLINTKLPGGKDGFSLLIIITAEFSPVQLGFGFTLNGVGGLLGLNREMRVEVLRQGLKDGTLESILFPTDVVANATKIISDIREVFPPEEGAFVFGIMGKIGWGTPTLITLDIGLAIRVPDPVKIAILGIIRAILPDEKAAIIVIKVSFIGTIEFDKKLVAFDASIFDSRLLAFTLEGDMGFRMFWGDNAAFLMTVGGFHPAYNPPPLDLLDYKRITINLLGGNNPRLTLEAYHAVSSNTVQFGAKVELYAKAWKFSVQGILAIDVLFQFSPFYFIAQIHASVAVKAGSSTLFSISLSGSLEGPTPWKVKGKASFKVLFVKVKVRISKTFGDDKDTELDDIDVLPKLMEALKDKRNWVSNLAPGSFQNVTIKEIDMESLSTGEEENNVANLVVDPSGRLTLSQKVVPLDLKIQKFGSQKPADANKFWIEEVTSDSNAFNLTDIKEEFAPAQFKDMDSSKKLSSKSFEEYNGGVKISSSANDLESSKFVKLDVEYEEHVIDKVPLAIITIVKEWFFNFRVMLKGTYVAKSKLSRQSNLKIKPEREQLKFANEAFTVVNKDNLQPFGNEAGWASQAEANDYLDDLISEDPENREKLQVVPNFEANLIT